MSTADGLVTVEAVINPALYWVIKAKSKTYFIVGIYGITPQEKGNQLQSTDHIVRLLEWWKRDNEKLKELFSGRKVEFIQKKLIDGVPFGNLFVHIGSFPLDVCHFILDLGIANISQYPDRDSHIIKKCSLHEEEFLKHSQNKVLPEFLKPKIKYPKVRSFNKELDISILSDQSQSSSLGHSKLSQSDESSLKSSDSPNFESARVAEFFAKFRSKEARHEENPEVSDEHLKFVDQLLRGNTVNITGEKATFVKESLIYQSIEDINALIRAGLNFGMDDLSRKPKSPRGRGMMLKTIVERDFNVTSSSESILSQKSTDVTSKQPYFTGPFDPLPAPGKLRKVFSMDMYGATALIDEKGKVVNRKPEPELEIPAEYSLSSSSSEESVEVKIPINNPECLDSSESLLMEDTSDREETDQELLERELVPLNVFVERLVAFGGLIHGDTSVIPKSKIHEMGLHPYVMNALEKSKLTYIGRSGAFAMPAVLTRRSMCLIGPPLSKKTMSVIIPLVSLLLDENAYKSLRPGCGPRAVIIVPFAETVRAVARMISQANMGYLTAITTCGGGLELERKDDLTNGCDIVISTPRCWLRLLEHRYVTNQKRLCHIFIDQINIIIDLFKSELFEILRIVDNVSAANRVRYQQEVASADGDSSSIPNPIEPQVLLVGDAWDPTLENIVLKQLKSPLLCLTSHLEAALYANVRPCIHFIKPGMNKEIKLINILQGKEKIRVVIACSKASDVKILRSLLSPRRKDVFIAHGELHFSLLKEVHEQWRCDKSSEALLIVSDDVLNDLSITNAQALIHYNMPENKTFFSNRFTAVRFSFADRVLHPDVKKARCSVDIMISDENAEQFPEIISFMSRLGTKIPEELSVTATNIQKIKEFKKTTLLCKNIIMFGHCWKALRCKERHVMHVEKDKCRPGIPEKGAIYFELLHVFSAVHFSIRLISHSASGELCELQPLPVSKEYVHLCMQMNSFYAVRDNRRVHGDARVGDLVAVETQIDTVFKRAMITKIITRDKRQNPATVNVKLIDFGTSVEMKVNDLLFLPESLHSYPPQSCEIYISGLLPVDKDVSWSFATTSIIKKELKQLDRSFMLTAHILYAIGGKLLVKDIRSVEYLEDNQVWITHFSVKDKLLSKKLAERNPNHLSSLACLSSDAGLLDPLVHAESCMSLASVGKSEKVSVRTAYYSKGADISGNQSKLVQWAFLPQDKISAVNFTMADHPALMYVTYLEFSAQLVSLEKDINNFMEKKTTRVTDSEVHPGYICLAKTKSDMWNRAKVEETGVELSEDGQLLHKIMFVDYGDLEFLPATSLAPCPNKFISTLPFQAIECDLIGLMPYNTGWSEECTDKLYEWTSILDDSGAVKWKVLYVKIARTDKFAQTTGGRHYSIILFDCYTQPPKVINRDLLTAGYANWNPEDKHFLSEENLEKIIDELSSANSTSKEPQSTDDEISDIEIEDVKNEKIVDEENKYMDRVYTVEELIERLKSNEFEYVSGNSRVPLYLNDLPTPTSPVPKPLPALPPIKYADQSAGSSSTETTDFPKPIKKSSTKKVSCFKKFSKKKIKVTNKEKESCDGGHKESPVPPVIWNKGILTPQTVWRQTASTIVIYILLPDVKNYHVEASFSYIYFSTIFNDKCYRMEVDLFGPIQSISHEAKGQQVQITALKKVKGVQWPRLTYFAEGNRWLKEYMTDINDDNDNLLQKLIDIGENKLKLGITPERNTYHSAISEWDMDESDSAGDNDSADEFFHEQDPFNPLGK